MKRLIVNADDFGLTESINCGIIAAHRNGILTSASLLANGPAFDEAIASSQHVPQLSVGVHLNISEGTPISLATHISTIVNGSGELYLKPLQLWVRILKRQINVDHIYTECRAQIRKVFEASIGPTHLDGHLHMHVLPQLSRMVIALAHEFHIPWVRCPTEDLEATLPLLWKIGGGVPALQRSAIAYAVASSARRLKEELRIAGLACPAAFLGLAHTGFLDTQALSALLALVPDGATELMCHPGYTSAQVESLGGELTHQRETEVLALTAREVKETVRSLGIGLTSFRDLEDGLAE
jgi:chitin disaccharide deacetylase